MGPDYYTIILISAQVYVTLDLATGAELGKILSKEKASSRDVKGGGQGANGTKSL